MTEVGKFKEAIESVIQITENFPITIDEWNDKFIELDVSEINQQIKFTTISKRKN